MHFLQSSVRKFNFWQIKRQNMSLDNRYLNNTNSMPASINICPACSRESLQSSFNYVFLSKEIPKQASKNICT